jgi:hypothetical protein
METHIERDKKCVWCEPDLTEAKLDGAPEA